MRNGMKIDVSVNGVYAKTSYGGGPWEDTGEHYSARASIDLRGSRWVNGRGWLSPYGPDGRVTGPVLSINLMDHPDDDGELRISKFLMIDLDQEQILALMQKCVEALHSGEEADKERWDAWYHWQRGKEEELQSEITKLRHELAEAKKPKPKPKAKKKSR